MKRWSARALAVQALLTFHLIDISLRLHTFEVVLGFLQKHSGRSTRRLSPAEQDWAIAVMRQAARQIRRFDVRARRDCLPRALTVYYLLRRRGIPVSFSMGIRKHPFGAHAWVEHQGQVISDYRDERSGYVQIMCVAGDRGA